MRHIHIEYPDKSMTHSEFVERDDIDCEKVLQRGGRNCGDENFAVFRCPSCHHIYLMDYEVDTVFTDPHDLVRERVAVFNNGFPCVACGKDVPSGVAWIGPKANNEFRVRYEDMLQSNWAWILKKRP